MDEFWTATARFLTTSGLEGQAVVAPNEMGDIIRIDSAYANVTPADANRINALGACRT